MSWKSNQSNNQGTNFVVVWLPFIESYSRRKLFQNQISVALLIYYIHHVLM